MTTHLNLRPTLRGLVLAGVIALLAACGGSDDGGSTNSVAGDDAVAESAADSNIGEAADSDSVAADNAAADDAEPTAQPSSTGGNATVALDNGETFEFAVLCVLESQMSAGSEILFTATSFNDEPNVDITQFGEVGPAAGVASVTLFDASYETVWDANTLYDSFGGTVDLSLDGSTITGSASFYPAGDIAATPVNGTIVANC